MRSSFTILSVVLLATATVPALAAPVTQLESKRQAAVLGEVAVDAAESGIGSKVASAVVSGVGSAVGGELVKGAESIGKKIKSIFRRDLTSEEVDLFTREFEDAIFAKRQEVAVAEAVADSGIGAALGKAVIGGVGGAIGGDLVHGAESIGDKIKSIFRREEIDLLTREYEEALLAKRQEVAVAEAVADSGIGAALGKAVIGGVGGAIGGDLVHGAESIGDKIKSIFRREEIDLLEREYEDALLAKRQEFAVAEAVADSGIGAALGKAVIGGVGGAIGGDLVHDAENLGDKIKSIFRRELSSDEIDLLTREYVDGLIAKRQEAAVAEAVVDSGLGSALAKGVVGGAGSAIGSQLIHGAEDLGKKIKSIFRRDASWDELD